MLGFFENIFRSNKTYQEQLLLALTQTEDVCRSIDNSAPGIYNFLNLIIDIYDIIPHISVERLCNIKYLDVGRLRLTPLICCKIIWIRESMRNIIDFLDDSFVGSQYNLAELSRLIEPFCPDIISNSVQMEPVLTEWPIKKIKEHEKYHDNPSDEEATIFKQIYDYEWFSSNRRDEVKPIFLHLVEQFEKKTDEVLEKLIPIDRIILQMYDRTERNVGQEIRDTIDSCVLKKKGTIILNQKDYEDYYLNDYLNKLKSESESNIVSYNILKAHQVLKPLSITDDNIKYYIFDKEALSDSNFRELIKIIIQITYLKEKCGLISTLKHNVRFDNNPTQTARVSSFEKYITRKDVADKVLALLHQHIDPQPKEKPRKVLKALRAAMDAGVIARPDMKDFYEEFKEVSKSRYENYTNMTKDPHPYSNEKDYEELKTQFEKL